MQVYYTADGRRCQSGVESWIWLHFFNEFQGNVHQGRLNNLASSTEQKAIESACAHGWTPTDPVAFYLQSRSKLNGFEWQKTTSAGQRWAIPSWGLHESIKELFRGPRGWKWLLGSPNGHCQTQRLLRCDHTRYQYADHERLRGLYPHIALPVKWYQSR